jgi:hypothetical protein
MQLTITHDFPRVAARLDELAKGVADRALSSTLNKAAEQGRTQAVRDVTAAYAVRAGYARERIQIRRASFKRGRFQMEVQIRAGNGAKRAANVIAFAARQNKVGVGVKIRRDAPRQTIRGAFIANKGRTVFQRTTNKRLPIKSVQTIDVPQMFNARKVKEHVLRVIRERLPVIAEREINFYVLRFNQKGR